MSDQDNTTETPQASASDTPQQTEAADSVKRGGKVIGAIIMLSLIWYLLADRFTPYTNQARVEGYVVAVAPKVAGLVTQVWVNNNQEVDEGEPLFQIDPSQYEIALARAQSDLESARRQVSAGSASVDSARANLLAAQATADKSEKNAERLSRLHQEDAGTISRRQLEAAQANLEADRARVTAAAAGVQAAIEQMGGSNERDNSILITAMTAVEKAQLDLENTLVRASSAGTITDLRTDVGNYAATGGAVMTLVAIKDVWISANYTENNLGHIQVGTPVEILFDALPGKIFPGAVRSIGLGVSGGDAPSPGTLPTIKNNRDWLRQAQRFPVVVSFDIEQEGLHRQLRVGGQVSVIAYSEGHGILRLLGKLYIRIMSWFSYAY
jgi:multidrug resistance efflux pump